MAVKMERKYSRLSHYRGTVFVFDSEEGAYPLIYYYRQNINQTYIASF